MCGTAVNSGELAERAPRRSPSTRSRRSRRCETITTLNVVVPGSIKDGKRAIWQTFDAVDVWDGGSDGRTHTVPNTRFASQGVFVP